MCRIGVKRRKLPPPNLSGTVDDPSPTSRPGMGFDFHIALWELHLQQQRYQISSYPAVLTIPKTNSNFGCINHRWSRLNPCHWVLLKINASSPPMSDTCEYLGPTKVPSFSSRRRLEREVATGWPRFCQRCSLVPCQKQTGTPQSFALIPVGDQPCNCNQIIIPSTSNSHISPEVQGWDQIYCWL